MKAAVTDGKGNIFFEDIPKPQIQNDYQCLCKINASATCTGTDIKLIDGTLGFGEYPNLFGHESVGTVIECGSKVRNFQLNDFALRPCAVYPGEKLAGFNSFAAGYTEYGLVTDRKAYLEDNLGAELNSYIQFQQRVPRLPGLTAVDLSMFITLKETASVVSLGTKCSIGKRVLVLGAGTVGLSMAHFSRIFGADIVAVGARRTEALQYAMDIKCCDNVVDFTADWMKQARTISPDGFDIIIDGTGVGDITIKAGALLNEDGKLYLYSTSKDKSRVTETLGEEKIGDISKHEEYANTFLINAVELGLINLKHFYSHVMPLEKIVEGFEIIKSKKALKVVFEC